MVPPWLAQVHPRTGTPMNATVVMLVATAVIALFTNLPVLSNLLSISTLFIFSLVALALLVRRHYVAGVTSAASLKKLVAALALIVSSSIATALYWAFAEGGWAGYAVTLPVWFAATAWIHVAVPQARTPKLWGVPLVPWLPSSSIAMNVFLLGSIDAVSFARFAVWTALLLLYYLFFGLHASYDTAVQAVAAGKAQIEKIEEGADGLHPGTAGDIS